jgi:hypothetical protein
MRPQAPIKFLEAAVETPRKFRYKVARLLASDQLTAASHDETQGWLEGWKVCSGVKITSF